MRHITRLHGRVTKLDRETRAFMERGFGGDFASVTLSLSDAAGPPRAWAVGERIHLDARLHAPETAAGRAVLAHELAHVVQKRRVGAPAPARLIEGEAHAAAACVASGGRFACALADRRDTPRHWGEAGHFWSSYFIMLAAGVERHKAFHLAFIAQMPDQVIELDATMAGYRIAAMGYLEAHPLAALFGLGVDLLAKMTDRVAAYKKQHPEISFTGRIDAIKEALHVQRGLHCLNGGPADPETEKWRQKLMAMPFGTTAYGLAIHCYGDSFAHRRVHDDTKMYPAFIGHAMDIIHFHDPHRADHIHERRTLYKRYGLGLYKILCERTKGHRKTEPMAEKEFERLLEQISAKKSEKAQIDTIREIAETKLRHTMSRYFWSGDGEEDPVPWPEFKAKYPGHAHEGDYRTALKMADTWSGH